MSLLPHRDAIAAALAQAAGGAVDADGRFPSPLPGHAGRAFLDVPDDDPSSDLRLCCPCGKWHSLGEVWVAVAYGEPYRHLSNFQAAVWTARLLYDVGALDPVPIRSVVPDGAPPYVACVAEGFALLVGLRWATGEQIPVTFSVRFAATWCHVDHREAHEAIRGLVGCGALDEVGRKRGARLLMPVKAALPDGDAA